MRDAIKNNDYDLEEQISKVLGDAVAHKIVFHARETKNTVVNSLEKLKNSAKEFIYYETKSFPTKKQIERFYVDVAVLRNDVDRLEARMHQLILNKQKN
ncbi:MAG: hypothetical protein ACD_29C00394G0002 [uncultured bacterium]|nr:MAG: hypothetical protein ACD_29C00394G0002 [uncultured bacterium]